MNISVDVSIDDLVRDAQLGDREELLDLIKKVDLKVGDWEFTLALCEHFAALKLEHAREEAEDAARVAARATGARP